MSSRAEDDAFIGAQFECTLHVLAAPIEEGR